MTRCYVPADADLLRLVIETAEIPAGSAHAVTDWLREAWPEAPEEDWEYAALMAAASESAARAGSTGHRIVLVVDAEVAHRAEDSTQVELAGPVPWARLAAIQADPDPIALDDEGDIELGWFATQEAGALLEHITPK